MRALLIGKKDPIVAASMDESGIEEVKAFYIEQVMKSRNWIELFAATAAHLMQMSHKMDYDGVSFPSLVDVEIEKGVYKTIL